MRADLKISGIDNVLTMLQQLPREVVSKRGGPVKLALKKGAQFLRNKAATKLTVATANTDDEGARHSTGFLLQNLITSRGKPPASGNGERYLVRVRRKSYPDRTGKSTTTTENASRLEYGTEKQPAEPWIRPAFEENAQAAIDIITNDLLKRVDVLAGKFLAGKKS